MEQMSVGVIMERRRISTRWKEAVWRPVAVVPYSRSAGTWQMLRDDGTQELFHAGHLPFVLYGDEAGDYLQNVSRQRAEIYVVLRDATDEAARPRPTPFLLTASPDVAAAYVEGGDEVLPVPMPAFVTAWVGRFAGRQPAPKPVERRRRRDRKAADGLEQEEEHRWRHPVWRAKGES